MPLGIIGIKDPTTVKPIPNRFAIVHNRTGRFLDICSDQYHIHKPREIATAAISAFRDIGMTVDKIHVIHGGESVILNATVGAGAVAAMQDTGTGGDYSARSEARRAAGYTVGQTLECRVSMKIGNTVGNPTRVSIYAIELACLNSLTRDRKIGVSVTNHRNNSQQVVINLQGLLPDIRAIHTHVTESRARLISAPATLETMRTYLLELSQPELFQQVLDKTITDRGQYTPDVQRNMFLDSVNSHDDVAWYLLNVIEDKDKSNRFTRRVIDNLNSQPMAAETRGTLYQPYMAATYAVDHLATGRGEFAQDNILDNSLFGQGQAFKSRALDLVLEYTQSKTGVN